MLEFLIISFVAGTMTVLAPCILPLLPVVVGGSLTEQKRWYRPFVITGSLAGSIIVFTLLLKYSTSLLGIPFFVWQIVAGSIIILLGIGMAWPGLWEPLGAKLNVGSSQWLSKAGNRKGLLGDILTGAALGPVFSSCSPTFAFIVASVLPVSFATGMTYLVAYAIGVAAILLLVALLGQKIISKLQWASNPRGWFKRTIGVLFIIVGIFIATGLDHKLQAYLVEQGWYDPFSRFEQSLMQQR